MSLTFPSVQKPSITLPTTVKDPSLKSDLINGMRISRAKYTRILREWSLQWNGMPDSELTTLLSFYDTVKGGSASFQWSDEFGNNYTVRFNGDIQHESVSDDRSSVSLKLEEV
ncbi:MAG: hypothetical protein HQM10_03930 [Candidatus Riflebacteria bacterium]|nr:hypothetical protein [Candidatus Riflebacteria bacterium]